MKTIKLINISKSFKDKFILNDISYEFIENNVYLLTGENGSGKSTLIKIILGFIRSTKGLIINNLVHGYTPDKINIPQYITVKEFIELLIKIRRCNNEYQKYIDLFNLNSFLSKKVNELSKGTFQKLLIIQSFLHNPDLLVFDEPLNGLDNHMQKVFVKLLKKSQKENKIIIIATHYTDIYKTLNPVKCKLENGHIC